MSSIGEKEREDLEMLLPWYVNGTLDSESVERIESALKNDPALRHSLEVLMADAEAANELAEADAVPASMEARFRAQLDMEPAVNGQRRIATRSPGILERIGEWIGDFIAAMTPPRLAIAVAAACLLVAVQSGIIVSMLGEGSGFETASGPGTEAAGPTMLVQYAPGADAAAITAFLESEGARIVDGPLSGGMYKFEFAASDERSMAELAALMREQPSLFALVLPGG